MTLSSNTTLDDFLMAVRAGYIKSFCAGIESNAKARISHEDVSVNVTMVIDTVVAYMDALERGSRATSVPKSIRHAPECPSVFDDNAIPCICKEIMECEARVRIEEREQNSMILKALGHSTSCACHIATGHQRDCTCRITEAIMAIEGFGV